MAAQIDVVEDGPSVENHPVTSITQAAVYGSGVLCSLEEMDRNLLTFLTVMFKVIVHLCLIYSQSNTPNKTLKSVGIKVIKVDIVL